MKTRSWVRLETAALLGLALLILPAPLQTVNAEAGAGAVSPSSTLAGLFDYKPYLFGDPPTLSINVVSVSSTTGLAELNGVDMGPVAAPFTWNWGDGSSASGWFPQSHTYVNVTKNYLVSVISHYTGGETDTAEALVRFVPATYSPDGLPAELAVTVPSVKPSLTTRLYLINPDLSTFGDSFFTMVSRNTLESILTLSAIVEMDLTNDDVYMYQSKFEQVMLRDSTFGGAYSIWFSNPVVFGVGDVFLQGAIGYSSLFHEMGHNFSLNTPGGFYYGGRIDGPANAIYSETMAQIYQHAAGWVLLNGTTKYDLDEDLAFEIRKSVTASMSFVRSRYDSYISSGRPFSSWNDPPGDATLATFMTIACKFFEHAESSGMGYRAPVKRMLHLLQLFDQGLMDAYDQNNNTATADSARATLLVAAVSYAFKSDLRSEFEDLNFPIDDVFYNSLISRAGQINTVPVLSRLIADVSLSGCTQEYALNLADSVVFSDPDGDALTYGAVSSNPGVAIASMEGTMLHVTPVSDGKAKITATADDGSGGTESTAFIVTVEACGCNCPYQGDIASRPTGDGVIDVFDVIEVIGIAFSESPDIQDPQCPKTRGDVNNDGVMDVFDVIYLIATAFSEGPMPVDPCAP